MVSIQIKVPNWLDRIFAWPAMWYRKRKYGYPFRKIRLTEGKFAIVDPQDFYWLNNFDWCAKEYSGCFHAVRFNNHGDKEPMMLSMHREIMKPPDELLVDHGNGDGLDNRRNNLRLATHAQNTHNRRKTRSKTSSKFIGVYFDKQTGRWAAKIKNHEKYIWLGRFDNEVDAARAYDKSAQKYRGEFARLNFPEESPPPQLISLMTND